MPIFKTTQKTLPPAAQKLLQAAARALIPNLPLTASWQGVPGSAVGAIAPKHEQLKKANAQCQSVAGAKLVSGWCLEQVRRKGIEKFVVIMEHHAVIEMPGGQLLCPNTPVGQEIRFLPDPSRPHDLVGGVAWNRAIYANVSVKGSLGVAPAYTLTWATTWGDDQAYSTLPLHAQWLSWAEGDSLARIESLGLSATCVADVVMMSDLDEVCAALQIKPHPSTLPAPTMRALLQEMRRLHAKGVFLSPLETTESSPPTKAMEESAI